LDDYTVTLRRFALRDDRYIASLLSDERAGAALSGLEPREHAFARIGALIAMNAAAPSFMSAVEPALRAGASEREVVGALIAVLPLVGVSCVVSVAPNVGLALGYDVSEAFEAFEPAENQQR
jgi:hypothetical protein